MWKHRTFPEEQPLAVAVSSIHILTPLQKQVPKQNNPTWRLSLNPTKIPAIKSNRSSCPVSTYALTSPSAIGRKFLETAQCNPNIRNLISSLIIISEPPTWDSSSPTIPQPEKTFLQSTAWLFSATFYPDGISTQASQANSCFASPSSLLNRESPPVTIFLIPEYNPCHQYTWP